MGITLKISTLLMQLFHRWAKEIVIWLTKVNHIVIIMCFSFVYLLLCLILNMPKYIVITDVWRTEFG
jgi:hypothetical protein